MVLSRMVKLEKAQHHWREQHGGCECEGCVAGFIADFLKGQASIYDFKQGGFKIRNWSKTNQRAWQSDPTRLLCVECGYPLDWRHPTECDYQSHPKLVSTELN